LKKRITNTFYNIDYYKYEHIRNLPQGSKIAGRIKPLSESEEWIQNIKNAFPEIQVFETEFYIGGEKSREREIVFKIGDRKNIEKYCRENNIQFFYNQYCCEKKSIPEGYLFSGWGTGHRTKIKADDLPKSFVYLSDYKKHGYLQTAGVKDIYYKPSPFHNHTYKDDFIYLSYDKDMDTENLWETCDEYVFGNDIVDVILSVEKYSPEVKDKVLKIKERMVEQYILYIDEMEKLQWKINNKKKIEKLEELL